MNPPPPMLPAPGYVTASANPTHTAASTALPPRFRMSMPARDANASADETIPCRPRAGSREAPCAGTRVPHAEARHTAAMQARRTTDDWHGSAADLIIGGVVLGIPTVSPPLHGCDAAPRAAVGNTSIIRLPATHCRRRCPRRAVRPECQCPSHPSQPPLRPEACPVTGLVGSFCRFLAETVDGSGDAAAGQRWTAWGRELFADLYSVLTIGPAAIRASSYSTGRLTRQDSCAASRVILPPWSA